MYISLLSHFTYYHSGIARKETVGKIPVSLSISIDAVDDSYIEYQINQTEPIHLDALDDFDNDIRLFSFTSLQIEAFRANFSVNVLLCIDDAI